jgi:hypothetical protein
MPSDHAAGHSVGLASLHHKGDALPRREVVIDQSPSKSQAALETMQSNGS